MLLGKRPRPPMKRTTSMTEITFDLGTNGAELLQPSDPHKQGVDGLDQRFLAMVSPRNHKRNSSDFLDTAPFLKSCSLCKRRLIPGRDIYMYRGDTAFCSLECRQHQMNQDERKDKCSVASKKESTAASASGAGQVSTNGETVAAS